jgi:hypothetical protein
MKSFIVITESGRVRGKITGTLYKVKANKPQRISDFGYSKQSNKGVRGESVKALITFGELSAKDAAESNFSLLLIEGQGLNYINQY